MSYFYFDTGLHRFLTKQHGSSGQQEQVDGLTLSLSNTSEVDLYSGFKTVWAPGLYLERIHLGSRLLKDIIKRINHITLTRSLDDDQFDDLFVKAGDEVGKIMDAILEEHLPLPCVPSNMIGYVGGMLVDDLNGRYTDNERAQLVRVCLGAEAMQQVLLDKLKGATEAKKKIQMLLFHSCIKGFFIEFFSVKKDINLSRMILMYSSFSKGIDKNKNTTVDGKGKRLIDPNKDIADGELIHFATFGTWINDELAPVYAVTFDSPDEIRARLIVVKSFSLWVMANLQYDQHLQWGRVFCINSSSHEITQIIIEELEPESWIYNECSEEALAVLKSTDINSRA